MPVKIKGTKFVYFPVPKVACTSIKTGILQHNDPTKYATVIDPNVPLHVHMVYTSNRFKPWIARIKWPNSEWFCMVRDPIKRAVSGYRNRILHQHDLEKTPIAEFEKADLSRDPDMNSFFCNLEAYSKLNDDVFHHFSPHCYFLGNKPERFAHIFKLSEMEKFTQLVADAGVALQIPHEQTGGPKVSVDDLSADARAALERFYAKDYRIWGDYFD